MKKDFILQQKSVFHGIGQFHSQTWSIGQFTLLIVF